ncbi:hypothetical protein L486_07592 [Kwoniella mangroviensis CBS 10435]|uniref:Mtf2-like C-terminal domain-containing protein n=1 Tax=Kwoniella mangroviensis CBS 10435 TaxID=1331196 RepID=A0A1B9IH52_9TREE|nr:hypothetical protein L486_07592 [Kwoniella mangroviensis CBS 10435]
MVVMTVAETHSRAIAHALHLLTRRALALQPTSIRQITTSSAVNDANSDRSKSSIDEKDGGSFSSVEVSRDMSSTAESSQTANSSEQSQNTSDEDRQYAEIFATLNEQWPKSNSNSKAKSTKASHPPKSESIASRLTFDGYSTPSPRHRGVHSRLRRSAGSTPKEAETFNEILAGIFADLNYTSASSSSPGSSRLNSSNFGLDEGYGTQRGIGLNDPYSATKSGLGGFGYKFGLNKSNSGTIKNRARNLRSHFIDLEKEDDKDDKDLELLEEFEMLKEEMEVISSDVELIEWSKNRVFKPLASIDNDLNAQTGTTGQSIITYSPTYPKILAHLLRTLRVNYNSPHLVLSLFNYAQNISLESYLSGCLTEVYNEVLLTRWESFRDLKGVELGIREMEIMGVNWDQITARLISKIVEEISKDLLSSSASASAPSTSMLSGEEETIDNGVFSNLASLTTVPQIQNDIYKKYGDNVIERLRRLDEKVSKDVRKQEKLYEIHQRRKRKLREEREQKLARQLEDDARRQKQREGSENEDGDGDGDGNRRVGYIEDPKEGERAYI